jgi:hypothetical protein
VRLERGRPAWHGALPNAGAASRRHRQRTDGRMPQRTAASSARHHTPRHARLFHGRLLQHRCHLRQMKPSATLDSVQLHLMSWLHLIPPAPHVRTRMARWHGAGPAQLRGSTSPSPAVNAARRQDARERTVTVVASAASEEERRCGWAGPVPARSARRAHALASCCRAASASGQRVTARPSRSDAMRHHATDSSCFKSIKRFLACAAPLQLQLQWSPAADAAAGPCRRGQRA